MNTSVLNPDAPPFSPPSSLTTIDSESSHSYNHNILLLTAHTTVFNPKNWDNNERVQIILDCRSQRSYITNNLKERLHIKPDVKIAMLMCTFGSVTESKKICDLVKIGVCTKMSTMELTLLSVQRICGPIAGVPVEVCRELYEHVRELELADTSQ